MWFCSFLECVKVSAQWPQHEIVMFVKCFSPQILIYKMFSSASVDQKQLLHSRLVGREEAVLRGRRSASPSLPSSQTTAFQPGMPWPTCLSMEMPRALSAVSYMSSSTFFPSRIVWPYRCSARSTFICLSEPLQAQ